MGGWGQKFVIFELRTLSTLAKATAEKGDSSTTLHCSVVHDIVIHVQNTVAWNGRSTPLDEWQEDMKQSVFRCPMARGQVETS